MPTPPTHCDPKIQAVERLIADRDVDAARSALRTYLYAQLPDHQPTGSIAEAISILAKDGAPHPQTAAYLLRCLAVPDLLPPSNPSNLLAPNLVTLAERALPGLCRFLELANKRQTHEKTLLLAGAHLRVCQILSPLHELPADLDTSVASKQRVLHALNHSAVSVYCQPFNILSIRSEIDTLFSAVARLSEADINIKPALYECETTLSVQLDSHSAEVNFLIIEYILPFLRAADRVVKAYVIKARGHFVTNIECRVGSNNTLEKRYPLHDTTRLLGITIPLRSTGPGVALAATVRLETDSVHGMIEEELIALGNILPGHFSTTFHIVVDSPCDSFNFMAVISWAEVGEVERKESVFVIRVASQSPDIDWGAHIYRKPYSTEVAKGAEFVGRSEKVVALAGNLLRTPMDSFYVTGQKRVGKTSLALAVLDLAKRHAKGTSLQSFYLLWGDIAHEAPRASLKALAERIARFMQSTFPAEQRQVSYDFDGTLAGPIPLAEMAYMLDSNRRYVVVLDEFDEIHPELYISGNLADTFFANLRAINTRENICIILVEGENMPFIMERQGQRLNKFVRATLDYFSCDDEWEDFRLLVRRPTDGTIHWHDDAVVEVFNVTNGSPYFAKIVCAKVYANVVKERDADITAEEVRKAIAAEIGALDTKSFVHLWQDGIYKAPVDRDPEILRRCRVLVAMARTARRGQEMTLENILQNKHSSLLLDNEVQPVLNDCMRREVLREADGRYEFVLPIFGIWLTESGINRLSSGLLEELATSVQAAEDAAYVHSREIAELARSWPTYTGRQIGTDEIRAWCEQVEGHRQQRLLFKLLQNLKIYGEVEIREKLRTAHTAFVRPLLPEFVVRRRSERRADVLVTYVDGEGKSGQFYASRYAEENAIDTKAIVRPLDLIGRIEISRDRGVGIAAVVIVDDIVATGDSLATNLGTIMASKVFRDERIRVIVITLTETVEGEKRVREEMQKFQEIDIDLRICDILHGKLFAFDTENIWTDREECERAKALCVDLGVRIYRDNPLGYDGQSLLVVFPESCPNNSLPILHSSAKPNTGRTWTPLFPRVVN
jgi:hypothetical protein